MNKQETYYESPVVPLVFCLFRSLTGVCNLELWPWQYRYINYGSVEHQPWYCTVPTLGMLEVPLADRTIHQKHHLSNLHGLYGVKPGVRINSVG